MMRRGRGLPYGDGARRDVPGVRRRPGTSPTSRPATSTPTPPAASTTTRPPRSPPTPASPSPSPPPCAQRRAARVRRHPRRAHRRPGRLPRRRPARRPHTRRQRRRPARQPRRPTSTLELVLVCDPDPAGRRVADALAPLLDAARSCRRPWSPHPTGATSTTGRSRDPGWADQLRLAAPTDPDVAIDAPTRPAISQRTSTL